MLLTLTFRTFRKRTFTGLAGRACGTERNGDIVCEVDGSAFSPGYREVNRQVHSRSEGSCLPDVGIIKSRQGRPIAEIGLGQGKAKSATETC